MKRMLPVLMFLILVLNSCTEDRQTVEYQGRRLDDAEILEHIQSVLSEEESSTEPSVRLEPKPWNDSVVYASEDCVYWTKSGSVYHTNTNCRYLPEDAELFYGTREDAVFCGKSRCCSACEKEN